MVWLKPAILLPQSPLEVHKSVHFLGSVTSFKIIFQKGGKKTHTKTMESLSEYIALLDITRLQEDPRILEIGSVLNTTTFVLSFVVFAMSTLSGNFSQVDKLWSVTPVIYAGITAYMTGFANARVNLMAFLVFVWGVRLTLNFARRGGYPLTWKIWQGEEDYRWEHVRKFPVFAKIPLSFTIFNLTFVSYFQMYLLLWLTLPALMAATTDSVGPIDFLLAALFLGLIATEREADRQQYVFQTEKYRLLETTAREALPQPYKRGFIVSGLWAYSRHPNYTCEISVWFIFALMSVIPAGPTIWSCIGSLTLLGLFIQSIDLSEGISSSKYPQYKLYQQTVSAFWPTPLGKAYVGEKDE